ncbi:MAG: DUF4282 domain-containing protein [Nocardioidaceae bacterium]|nr:DUF4282 domain-containing protein [Nocardioidaceae bacterium]
MSEQDPYGQQPPAYGGQPPTGGGHSPYPGGADNQDSSAKGFFAALFDFSFTHFVTPKIVKVVYILATVAMVVFYLILVVAGLFSDSPLVGVLVLLLGWIPFLIYLALIRMTLEFYYALIRMSEDIHERLPR